MTQDDTSPATKGEIKELLGQLEERLMHHVDVRYEDIRHDVFGAMNDRLSLQDDRIMRVVQATGVELG